MFEEIVQEIQQSFYAGAIFHTNISISDTPYRVLTNKERTMEYFKKLFYPSGVNGVYFTDVDVAQKEILAIQDVKKEKFLSMISTLREEWERVKNVYPVVKGFYEVYEHEQARCYVQDYADATSSEHIIWSKDGVFIIFSIESEKEFLIPARFIREIGFRKLEDLFYIGFHASAVEIGSDGYLIVGDSGAGKSTLALTLCKYYGARYISNDRILVKVDGDEISAIPFAIPVKVNYGTLQTLGVEADFRLWKQMIPMASKETFFHYKGEHKLNLLPEEIEKFLHIKVGSQISLKGIILPSIQTEEPNMQKEDQVRDIVERNCFYHSEPVFVEDWLKIRTHANPMSKSDLVDQLLKLNIYKEEIAITDFRRSAGRIMQEIAKDQ